MQSCSHAVMQSGSHAVMQSFSLILIHVSHTPYSLLIVITHISSLIVLLISHSSLVTRHFLQSQFLPLFSASAQMPH